MSEMYNPQAIEAKWHDIWDKQDAFAATDDYSKPKYYALVEFPYPSGQGLHVGHPRPYTALDIVSRKRRMQGYNVLFPMGWDAFGLPTENYAIKNHIHPKIVTKNNVGRFKEQLRSLGYSFDWKREINTTDPEYYKWIVIVAAALTVILLVGFILFAVLYAKTLKRYKKLLAAKKRAALRRREKEKIKQDTEAVLKIDKAEKENVADDIIFEPEKEEEKPDFDGIIDLGEDKPAEKQEEFDGEIIFDEPKNEKPDGKTKKKKNNDGVIFDDETINLLFGDDSDVPPEK